jgi:hypothetical protein
MQVISKMYFGSQVLDGILYRGTHNVIKDVTELVDSDKKTPDSLGHIQYKTKKLARLVLHTAHGFLKQRQTGGGRDLVSGLQMDGFLFNKITGKTLSTRD